MSKLRKPKAPTKQALSAIKTIQKAGDIKSVGTLGNYESALTQVAKNMQSYDLQGEIRDLTPQSAVNYLEHRGEEVGQKTLDKERQAIQALMRVTDKLTSKETLTVVKSSQKQILKARAYTPEQVKAVAACQRGANALATLIAHDAGLRAHELLTLRPIAEVEPDVRRATVATKFINCEDKIPYTVCGKGGLIREVRLSKDLSSELEALKLTNPKLVIDRNINYQQHYDISGGIRWSSSFSKACKRALGWSEGAHGCRHSYAQQRMNSAKKSGLTRIEALTLVSQEMGHLRPEITETYLR